MSELCHRCRGKIVNGVCVECGLDTSVTVYPVQFLSKTSCEICKHNIKNSCAVFNDGFNDFEIKHSCECYEQKTLNCDSKTKSYTEKQLERICFEMMNKFGEHVAKTITGKDISMIGEMVKIETQINEWFNNEVEKIKKQKILTIKFLDESFYLSSSIAIPVDENFTQEEQNRHILNILKKHTDPEFDINIELEYLTCYQITKKGSNGRFTSKHPDDESMFESRILWDIV